MQQLHTTAEPQNEQTLSYAPAEIALPPEHALTQMEVQQEAQEQSEAVEKLLAALERGTKKRQKWNNLLTSLFCAYVAISLIAAPIIWVLHQKVGGLYCSVQLAYITYMLGSALGALFLDKKSAAELAQLNDVRCIGSLVDIWGWQGTVNYAKRTREQVRDTLIHLLPQMQASDMALFKESQRVILRGVLARAGNANSLKDKEVEFTLAILKAFEQVGDWKSADCVKTLTSPANPKRIRAAAKECLPFLQALAEKQKPGENLLRASSASEAAGVAPKTLLRPASATEEARPDTLLRAVDLGPGTENVPVLEAATPPSVLADTMQER